MINKSKLICQQNMLSIEYAKTPILEDVLQVAVVYLIQFSDMQSKQCYSNSSMCSCYYKAK